MADMDQEIPQFKNGRFAIVGIGASTGAPGQIDEILRGLPADLSVPILIAQHLPPTFTAGFAAHLDRQSPLTVVEAEDGMPVLPGTVYIGRGHQHLRVRPAKSGKTEIEVSPEPTVLPFKPSADELLTSIALRYGRNALGVIMTGIGRDGTRGAGDIIQRGGMVLTQSKATCVVYGMPKSCFEAGFSTATLSPDEIRQAILQLSPGHGTRRSA